MIQNRQKHMKVLGIVLLVQQKVCKWEQNFPLSPYVQPGQLLHNHVSAQKALFLGNFYLVAPT